MATSGEEGITVGHRIGPYRLDELLGQGSMGAVFRAIRDGGGDVVALKVIHLPLPGQEDTRARLRREVEILARLDHPGIVRFHEVVLEGAITAIAMEHVAGASLGRVLTTGDRTMARLFAMTGEVLEALEHAWVAHGIVHRDIKPSNILVDGQEKIKLVDFGLARSVEHDMGASTVTVSGTILGTPHYMAPEQAMGRRVDFRADLYSVGVILYQIVTGRLPFTGSSPLDVILKHRDAPVIFSASEERRLPAGLRERIACFLGKDAGERPRDFGHARALLGECVELLGAAPVEVAPLDRTLPVESGARRVSGPLAPAWRTWSDTRAISTVPSRRWGAPQRVGRAMMFGMLASLSVILPRVTLSPVQALPMTLPVEPSSTGAAGPACPGASLPPPPDFLPGYSCVDDFPGQSAGSTPKICRHTPEQRFRAAGEEPAVQNSHRTFRDLFAEAARLLAAGDRSLRTERLACKVEEELTRRIVGLDLNERLFDLPASTRQVLAGLKDDCAEAKRRLRNEPAGSYEWFVSRWNAAPVGPEDRYMLDGVFLLGDMPMPPHVVHHAHDVHAHSGD